MNKLEDILNGKGSKVLLIFLKDWQTLQEASIEYNTKLEKSNRKDRFRTDRTVVRYYNAFKKPEMGYIKSKNVLKHKKRLSKHPRWKATLKPFFNHHKTVEFTSVEKRIIELVFLSNEYIQTIDINNNFYSEVSKILLSFVSNSINKIYSTQYSQQEAFEKYRIKLESNDYSAIQEIIKTHDNKGVNMKILVGFLEFCLPLKLIIKIMSLEIPFLMAKHILDDFLYIIMSGNQWGNYPKRESVYSVKLKKLVENEYKKYKNRL